MSIEVPISQLHDELTRREFGYLVTVGDDARSHVVALRPRFVSGPGADHDDEAVVLRFETGSGRAFRNAAARPDVTVVFPPSEPGAMSLIVDGTAATVESDDRRDDHDGAGDRSGVAAHVDITPTWAVLHRAAPPLDPSLSS